MTQHNTVRRPYIICVHGNIGVGKSTYINSRKDCVQIVEKIDEWNLKPEDIELLGADWCVYPPANSTLFAEYNRILANSDMLNLTRYEQKIIIEFQCVVMRSRVEVYENINPSNERNNYIIERSIYEDFNIFGKYF